MKKFFLTLLTCLCVGSAMAVPARRSTFTVTQPDGTVLTLQMVGDEYFHYFLEVNTGKKMLRNEAGLYYVPEATQMNAMQARAMERASLANTLRAERFAKNTGMTLEQRQQMTLEGGPKRTPGNFNGNMIGTKKGLVILVNFTDRTFAATNTRQDFDDSFNLVGYDKNSHIGSVHDYFSDQSYGQFDLQFDVVGPVTVSQDYAYYGKNYADSGTDTNPAKMVSEACQLVDDQVDFNDYDWDGDGEVDQVYVIYAGYGEHASGDTFAIWPHEAWLSYGYGTSALTLDGAKIDTYACSCELRGSTGSVMNGIGTACHEFSHCIGYPDFYDTRYGGGFGMNVWDLLDQGCYNGPSAWGEVPSGYTAYERWMAGWLEPKVLDEGTNIEGMKFIGDAPDTYIIYNPRYENEYFLLENRQSTRWFRFIGNYTGAHGLMVTHVDFLKSAWTANTVNNTVNHQRMSIVPADCDYGTKKNGSYYPTRTELCGDLFPGNKKVTAFDDDSHMTCGGKLFQRNTDSSYKLHRPITNIKEIDGEISFTFNGGPDDGTRYTVTYETGENGSCTTSSWTQQSCREKTKLPTATTEEAGWKFLGWSTSPVEDETEVRPEVLLLAGDVYQPETNVTLYAVYCFSKTGVWEDSYLLADALPADGKVVFVSTNEVGDAYALDASLLTTTKVRSVSASPITLKEVANKVAITNPAKKQVWTCAYDEEGYYTLKNSTSYLLASLSGVALSTSMSPFGWHDTFGLYGTSTNGTSHYYLRSSNDKITVSSAGSSSSRVYAYVYDPAPDGTVIFSANPHVLAGVTIVTTSAPSSITYDLTGRRVNSASHGVFIINGKKVIK